jgi:hypothetical protein
MLLTMTRGIDAAAANTALLMMIVVIRHGDSSIVAGDFHVGHFSRWGDV